MLYHFLLIMKMHESMQIFETVRDIPYMTSANTLRTCFYKCNKLKEQLTSIGYECELMIGDFKWSALQLPSSVMYLCDNDHGRHVVLRVRRFHQDWIILDPTIDKMLSSHFQVEVWDGVHSTGMMMPLDNIRIYNPYSVSERVRSKLKRLLFFRVNNHEFYEAVDSWLTSIRNQYHEG